MSPPTDVTVEPPDATTVAARAGAWGRGQDISARSALVTILGDSIAPLGGSVWLADLISLAEPFGFSERLVRTSMFRLASEEWVTSERIGRRSRYSLTPSASEEFSAADARIYRHGTPEWDGLWTLVFVDGHDSEGELLRRLRWRGFAPLARGVYASPSGDGDAARELFARLEVQPEPAVAAARFDRTAPDTLIEPFRRSCGLTEAEAGYGAFVERYRWTETADLGGLAHRDAFLLRTMLTHDLRRARLRDPGLPAALLPADWIGDRAMALAGRAYRAVTGPAWAWIETITGLRVDPVDPRLSRRFATAA